MRTKQKNQIFSQQIPFFMSMPALLWQTLFLYIPLIAIIVISFVHIINGILFFTLSHYVQLLDIVYLKIIARSTMLALVTASMCLLLAYPVVYFLVFRTSKFKNIFLFFLILPFWTSLLVQAYAWFFVLEKYGLVNTILSQLGLIAEPLHILNTQFSTYLVMVYCYLPYMILPLYSTMEKLDRKLIEASLDLGASPLQTLLRVTLPLSLPGIKTGFFLVFVPSFGEFVIPVLMGGGKRFYIGSLIEHYFLVARDLYAGAAFTCLSGLVLLSMTLLIRWYFNYIIGARVKE